MNKLVKKFKALPKILQISLGCAAVGFVLLVVALIVALSNHSRTVQPVIKPTPPIAVVEITPNGFVPSTLHVSKGTKVIWVNNDNLPHRIAADPYPTHTSLPALFAPQALGNKQTYSFIFTKPKTVNYHDDLNPTAAWEGVIIVK